MMYNFMPIRQDSTWSPSRGETAGDLRVMTGARLRGSLEYFAHATCENLDVEGNTSPHNCVTELPEEEQTADRPLANHLAARLRELRARRGFTQDHVAKRLGCHESAVSRWESGSRFPTGEDLVALADLFEVSTDDLLGRERQFAAPGSALVDMRLLGQLAAAESTEDRKST